MLLKDTLTLITLYYNHYVDIQMVYHNPKYLKERKTGRSYIYIALIRLSMGLLQNVHQYL